MKNWLWEDYWSKGKAIRKSNFDFKSSIEKLYSDAKEDYKARKQARKRRKGGKESIKFNKLTLDELKEVKEDIAFLREEMDKISFETEDFREIEKAGVVVRLLDHIEKDVKNYITVRNSKNKDKRFIEYLAKNAYWRELRKEARKALQPSLLFRILRFFFRI